MVDVTFENNTARKVNVIWYTFTGGTKNINPWPLDNPMFNRPTPNMFGKSQTPAANVFPPWWSKEVKLLKFNKLRPKSNSIF